MATVINTRLTTSSTISAGGIVPVGTVVHKSGCNITAGGNAITINGAGFYKITASITVEPTAVADMVASLYSNGSAIATASVTPAVASDTASITLVAVVYNKCSCATNNITVGLNSAGTVTEMDIVVERV